MSEVYDIGNDHFMSFYGWNPDDLPGNVELYGYPLPDIEMAAVCVSHPHRVTGKECQSIASLRHPEEPRFQHPVMWDVQDWNIENFTMSPSILCECGDHGFIQQGRWVGC